MRWEAGKSIDQCDEKEYSIPSSVDGVNVRYANGAADNSGFVKDVNGAYEAEIEILRYIKGPDGKKLKNPDGSYQTVWEKKRDASTFFPDTWDEDKIISEIEFAYSNKINYETKGGNTRWRGISREGVVIEGFLKNSDNTITSSYPIYVK